MRNCDFIATVAKTRCCVRVVNGATFTIPDYDLFVNVINYNNRSNFEKYTFQRRVFILCAEKKIKNTELCRTLHLSNFPPL